jgi:superfamily II DNA or RNA helicase
MANSITDIPWYINYEGVFQGNVLLMKLTPDFMKTVLTTLDIDCIRCMTNKDNLSITEKTFVSKKDGTRGFLPLGFLAANQFVKKLYHDRVKCGLNPISIFDYFKIKCETLPPLYFINSKIEFKKTLKEDQVILMNKFKEAVNILNAIKAPNVLTIKASTGIGKTFLALNIIQFYKLKTIIIVPKRAVISNWIKELNEAGISSVGSLQGSKAFMKNNANEKDKYTLDDEDEDEDSIDDFNMEDANKFDKDVIIVVRQHFNNITFKKFLMSRFSLLIIDECHMSNIFKNQTAMAALIYPAFVCTISMSATPKPKTEYVFGYMIEHENNNRFEKYLVKVPNIVFEHIIIPERNFNRKDMIGDKWDQKKKMEIEKDITRNLTIYFTACNLNNSKTLIFCKYRMQMFLFYELLKQNRLLENVILADAQAGNNVWEKILTQTHTLDKYFIIGTIDHLGAGVDIPCLDNLLIVFSKQSVTEINQALGRLERGDSKQVKYAFIFPETTTKYYRYILNAGTERSEQVAREKHYATICWNDYLTKTKKTDLYKNIYKNYSIDNNNIPDYYNVSSLINNINIFYNSKSDKPNTNEKNILIPRASNFINI